MVAVPSKGETRYASLVTALAMYARRGLYEPLQLLMVVTVCAVYVAVGNFFFAGGAHF